MANPYDVPPEMREFAERSVAQARKAFEGFIGAIQKASTTFENATPIPGAKDMSSKAVAFAETNVISAFDLADKLVQAKDVQEVLAIQADYLKTQLSAIETQMKELGAAVQKATGVQK